ncbi:MAG: winged helix DNA-binding protein [Bacteroidia bacterium]|nr:winged helix DNA-binding protein [Bacteroidia bacterium]
MSLEKDIQQREFRSEHQKALLNLLYTNNHVVSQMNDMFKNYEVTRQQFNVLRILRGQYPGHASVNLIKERMLDKMSDASRIVERLRVKGFLTREHCESDKRAVQVTITESGLALLTKMENDVAQLDSLLNNLSEDETRTLNVLLEKIRS